METSFSSVIENEEELLADGDNLSQEDSLPNSYDAFMKKHLQHYGYYTGQNAVYRENFRSLQEWRKNYDVRLSGQRDLSVMEEHFGRSGSFSKFFDMPSIFSTDESLTDELLHRTTQLVFHYQAGRKIPKLREPRNLYALTKEAGPQQATRWPSHVQVVCPAIRFIDYTPPIPDPMYQPTGREITPSVRGPQMGEVIFYNDPGRDMYFMRSRVAGCRLAMRATPPPREYPDDNLTLEFESRFESGNLLKVDKINDFDYELTLRTDLYTSKHTQWFFFRVRNMRPGKNYRFTIINLMKPSSLYNQGMKPVFYSELNAQKNKIGWIRTGSNIRYYRNNICGRDGRSYYSLTWNCEFPYKDDCCYFAHCYPYTYSDLQEYLLQLANDPVRSRYCKQRVLTRTLAGNLVYILTITSPSRNPEISRSKRAVVITARVHPGETNASWMMKGFLDYLTSSSADAKLLRDTFIFKIVPMLNPDGVIVGNYRCSLAGRDLNRNYKSVLKDSFPSIWHTKMMVKRLNSERQVVVYCDLHGHSRKNNIFIYGCENKHDRSKRLQERVFPLMLSKNASQSFSFDSCKYKVQKSKEGTGRIVVWYMGIMNSYTMEATFGGTSLPGKRKNTHLSTKDLEMMGYHFCDTLLDYCDPDESKVRACMRELQDHMKQKILKRLQMQNPDISDINLDDFASDFESDTSGSDSSCDDGLPVHLLAIAPKLQRKKKFRSRRDKIKVPGSKSSSAVTSSDKTMNNSQKMFPDKAKPLRYARPVSSNKRKEDRQPAATTIVGALTSDGRRSIEKSSKKSEYLDALTSAYIRSGVLISSDSKDYSLRYTNNNNNNSNNNKRNAQDGNFAMKYLSNHLDNSSGPDSDLETRRDSPAMCNASSQWSPQPDCPAASSDTENEGDVDKDAILAEEQYELLRQSALRRQLSADQQRMLAKKHLIAVASKQQKRSEENQRIGSARSCFDLTSRQTLCSNDDPARFSTPDSVLIVSPGGNLSTDSFPTSGLALVAKSGRPNSSTIRKSDPNAFTAPIKSEKSLDDCHGEEIDEKIRSEGKRRQKNEDEKPHFGEEASIKHSKENNSLLLHVNSSDILRKPQPAASTPKDKSKATLAQRMTKQVKHFFTKAETDLTRQQQSVRVTGSEANEHQHSPGTRPKTIATDVLPTEKNSETAVNDCDDEKELQSDNRFDFSRVKNQNQVQKSPVEDLPFHDSRAPLPDISNDGPPVLARTDPSLLNLARPSATNSAHQPDTTCMVKGEILLPNSGDKPIISNGVKTVNSVVIEPETEPLTIHSNRSNDCSFDSSIQKNKMKQVTDDSFFGMSDRVGLKVIPRNSRVPAVVANIAELRRSLLGHGKERSENAGSKNENPRKVATCNSSNMKIMPENFLLNNEPIPFTKRPRRRNVTLLHKTRKEEANSNLKLSLPQSKSETEMTKERDRTETSNTELHLTPEIVDDFFDDDIDAMNTVASFSENRRRQSRRLDQKCDRDNIFRDQNQLRRDRNDRDVRQFTKNPREQNRSDQYEMKRKNDYKIHDLSFQVDSDKVVHDTSVRPRKSEPNSRRYTQGNTTIEKQSKSPVTNIRVGSRGAGRTTFIDQQFESQMRPDGSASRSDTRHSVSSVSLNMQGEEDRVCVSSPALASRPAPPLLRYLSAKQGMNKKK